MCTGEDQTSPKWAAPHHPCLQARWAALVDTVWWAAHSLGGGQAGSTFFFLSAVGHLSVSEVPSLMALLRPQAVIWGRRWWARLGVRAVCMQQPGAG